jgi:hypothetical protein
MNGSENQDKPFVSALGAGREAFHSEISEYCLRIGERSAEDFILHFPPARIMKALASRPTERARIVSQATGIHDKVAHRMSPEASGEALQIALDEKVTSPGDIVRLFQPDDRQRYLDRKALWKFDVEGQPWKAPPSNPAAFQRAKAYIAYIMERGLANLLMTHEEMVAALTVQKLATSLPKEQLGSIIQAALGRKEKFTEQHLLEMTPPEVLVQHISLEFLWDRVIVPLIASRHGYLEEVKGPTSTPAPAGASTPGPFDIAKPAAAAAPADTADVSEDDIVEDDLLEPDTEIAHVRKIAEGASGPGKPKGK